MRTNGPQSFKVTPMHPLSVDAEPVAARSAATLLGRRALALALMLATVLTVAPRASAATMVLKGRFACNDGGALADVRVELLQIYSRRLPEITPNVQVARAIRADANGGWGFRVSGSESNWRVRAVLVNGDVGVKDFGLPWHHYADTLRTQNNRPLADYGTQVVPGAECRLWRAFRDAADGYRRDTGGGHPGGPVTVFENAPTAGVPFTPYTDVFWPAGYSPTENVNLGAKVVTRSVAQHEYAHTFRHALDGGKAHFALDSARFWYLRTHSGSACEQTNHGFAFNEGWSEYWADESRDTPCPDAPTDFSIERNVAFELKRLERTCAGVTRGRMVAVLAQNPGRIHSMSDFSNALGCVPRRVISVGKPAPRPSGALSTLARMRTAEGRKFVAAATGAISRARSSLSAAKDPWARTLAAGRLAQALALGKTFSYLASAPAQRKIVRRSDEAQVQLLLGRQRTYLGTLRAISVRTVAKGAAILRRQGDAAGARVLTSALAKARGGDLEVLQAIGLPLPAPSRRGPSPAEVDIVDVGGAPTPAPAPSPSPAPAPSPTPPPPSPGADPVPPSSPPGPTTPSFADFTSVTATSATGTLLGASISLRGTEVTPVSGGTTIDGSSTRFDDPAFSPRLLASDAVQVISRAGSSYGLVFGRPVTDPVLHIASLASRLRFPAGTTLTKVSGQATLTVDGSTVTGAVDGSSDANGTIRVTGTYETLSFSAEPLFDGRDGVVLQVGAAPPP